MRRNIQQAIFLTILLVEFTGLFAQEALAQVTTSQIDFEATNLVTVFQGLKNVRDNYLQIQISPNNYLVALAQQTNSTLPKTVMLLQSSINECLAHMQNLEYVRAQGGPAGLYADSVIQRLAAQYRLSCPRSIAELLSRPY